MVGALNRVDAKNRPQYRDEFNSFVFMYANTILHEMTHVFFTALGYGRVSTPPSFAPGTWKAPPEGESGRKLEVLALGGCLNYSRDPVTGTADKLVCWERTL